MNEAVNNATSIDPAHQCYINNFLVSQKKKKKMSVWDFQHYLSGFITLVSLV